MKKLILVLILIALTLCGCKKNEENNEETATNEQIVEGDSLSFQTGLIITNNDAYDESGKREFDFNTLLGNYDGMEVYSEGNQTFITNIDGNIIVTLLFKNTSDKTLGFGLSSEYKLDGTYTQYIRHEDVEVLVHPNGCNAYVLEPGEEKTAEIDLTLPHGAIYEDISESLIINETITITDMETYASNSYDISIEETIEFLSEDTLLSSEYKNAVVKGVVRDEDGDPVSGVGVKVTCPFIELWNAVKTDENGEFSVTVIGAKSTYSNAWREYSLIIEDSSYSTRYIPIYPKSNQTITADITIYTSYVGYNYEEVKTVDLGLQAYEYDTDQNSTIAFVPFHTGYDSEDVADLIKLTVTDFDGNVLYTHQLPEEVPYVDLSEDGKYTTVVENGSDGGFSVLILDESGNEVYRTHNLKQADVKYAPSDNVANTISRCSQLSNDNKYLVASDIDGNIWFIDWQNDEVLWSDWQMGQIRNIKFDENIDRMYVSTGGGDLLCYDLSGNIIWKADTQSWATNMEVTDKCIVLTTKCCGKSLLVINKENGELVWDYPTLQTSMSLAISPNEKYLWFGGHSSSSFSKIGCSIFDLDSGEIIGMITDQNFDGGQFSGDGSIIVTRDDNNIYVNDVSTGMELYRQKIEYDGSTTLNMAVAVNYDGSKFVVTMNDKGDGYYGTAHYFNLLEIRVSGDAPESIREKYDNNSNNNNDDGGNDDSYILDGNDITFNKSTECDEFREYDNITINEYVEVSLATSNDIMAVKGFMINDSLNLKEGASIVVTGDDTYSPRLEFNNGATATGIELYSEGGDLLNAEGDFINDSGSMLAFEYEDGKWVVQP